MKYQNSSSEVNFNFTLENVLFPKTVYNLTLSGCSNAGCGPFTSTSFETLEMSELFHIYDVVSKDKGCHKETRNSFYERLSKILHWF